jgi:putative transposase
LEEIFKRYQHNPPHLFRPKCKYFITGATYQKKHFLKLDFSKEKTVEYMFKSFEHFGWKIEDWVMLNNHYHVMADAPEDASTLPKVINNLHKFSALWIKKHATFDSEPEHIWYNYRDTCITYENSYFARLNYIWFNPVKHNYVQNPEEWKFGSYGIRARNSENVAGIIKKYPYDRVRIEDDF